MNGRVRNLAALDEFQTCDVKDDERESVEGCFGAVPYKGQKLNPVVITDYQRAKEAGELEAKLQLEARRGQVDAHMARVGNKKQLRDAAKAEHRAQGYEIQ
jgi:hypothetical protein